MSRRWSWLIAAALAGLVVPVTTASADEEKENETKVSMDQVPAAARASLLKESAGGAILDVVQETEHGQTVYEAHVRKGSELLGITVDASGKVLETENETGEHQ
jgi:uncharacterized membrane protein YkoI